jgi:NTP pyrophosphatase (non-canonical NTP hydrolase)
VTIAEFQKIIHEIYFDRDNARGMGGTFMWFVEEVGELATALRSGSKKEKEEEFADVFAWLVSLASMAGIDMTEAIKKYADGCPRCHRTPCTCSPKN